MRLLLQELTGEQQPLLITPDNLDRIIVSRLIEAAPAQYPQQPFPYLLGCYSRAVNEQRSLGQDAAGQQLREAVEACKQLLVSYAGLVLVGAGVVPEVRGSQHTKTFVEFTTVFVQHVHDGPEGGMLGQAHRALWQLLGAMDAPKSQQVAGDLSGRVLAHVLHSSHHAPLFVVAPLPPSAA
jgi:hypothetical protein